MLFFQPNSDKSAIQNNPLVQLRLIFHKIVKKQTEIVKIGLVAFQQLKKL